jgi:transcription elongation factor Elf1
MENRKCPVLVDGKECGLALVLVEQDIDTETEIYECPRGHRKNVMLGEIEKRECPALIDGKECGLALTVVEREVETATKVYECPVGHRTYVPMEPEFIEKSS